MKLSIKEVKEVISSRAISLQYANSNLEKEELIKLSEAVEEGKKILQMSETKRKYIPRIIKCRK